MLIRILPFLIISLSLVSSLKAYAGLDHIAAQRAWAEKVYANPEKMTDRELMEECLGIIAHNFQEEKALNLVGLAAGKVPALKDYLVWRKSGTVDTLNNHKIEALKALMNYCDKEWTDSRLAFKAHKDYLGTAGTVYDKSDEWKKLIERYSKKIGKKGEPKDRALLTVMKIINFFQTTIRRNFDDASLYPYVFQLEKEALEAYPPESDDTSLERAELYYSLGEIKGMIYNDFVGGLLQAVSDFNRGTSFRLNGLNRRYPCNSAYYYEKALEIAEAALNPGHPFVREIAFTLYGYKANTTHLSEDLINQLKDEVDYIKFYYPLNSMDLALARVYWCLVCLQAGIPTTDDLFLNSAIDILQASLGETNPSFHQNLFQLALTYQFIDPTDNSWMERMKSAMEKSGLREDGEEITYMMTQMMRNLQPIDPVTSKTKMDELCKRYLDTHNASTLSILTGRVLAEYYLFNVFNHSQGLNLLGIVLADQGKLFGKTASKEPAWWETILITAENLDRSDVQQSDKYYSDALGLLELTDFTAKNLVKANLLMSKAQFSGNVKHNYREAADLYKESATLLGNNTPDLKIRALTQAAYFEFLDGVPFEKSLPLVAEAIKCYKQADPNEILSSSLQNITSYYSNQGLNDEALKWAKEVLSHYESTVGKEAFSEDYIMMRRDLASAYEDVGQLSEARRILGEDADMVTEAFGLTPNPMLLDGLWLEYYSLRNDNLEDYVVLLPKLTKINELTMQLINASGENPIYKETYLLRSIGELVYMMAYNWDDSIFNSPTPEMKSSLDAQVAALSQFVTALETILGEIKISNPNCLRDADYRSAVTSLSTYYSMVKKDYDKSLQLQGELLDKEINVLNIGDYMNYAWSFEDAGNSQKARETFDRIEAAIPGLNLSDPSLMNRISTYRIHDYIRLGKYSEAIAYARDYFARHKTLLNGNFRLMTTQEQDNYMQTNGDPAWSLTTLLEYLPAQLSAETYDAVVYRTGMQLRSHRATMEAIEKSADPEIRNILDSLSSLRNSITNVGALVNGMTPEENNARTMKLSALRHRANRMEQKLLASIRDLQGEDLADIKWQQIRDCLKPGQAAVEFLYGQTKVMALVLLPGASSPLTVSLCSQEELIDKLRNEGGSNSAARAKNLYRDGDTSLYEMLWRPLEESLTGCTTVFCSFPGILSNLSFNAFPTPDGQRLFDKFDLVQLSTTAQLVFDHAATAPKSIAIMGDILYDESQQPLSPDNPGSRDIDMDFVFDMTPEGTASDSDTRALKKSHFRHLPFTALEIENIAAEFNGSKVDSERRLAATEKRLREMAGSHPDILHLATHGYYITGDRDINAYPFLKAKGGGAMQRSGIALAGAEKTWTGKAQPTDENDGILTAAEVAELNLKGTQIVALSACETALGDYSFEGIFGLQRGFKQAGVESLLVSLWSVNDRSTSLFMTHFYNALRKGESRQSAWRKAVEKVRDEYPDPYHWASFILIDPS